jgi:hypothetical protein
MDNLTTKLGDKVSPRTLGDKWSLYNYWDKVSILIRPALCHCLWGNKQTKARRHFTGIGTKKSQNSHWKTERIKFEDSS